MTEEGRNGEEKKDAAEKEEEKSGVNKSEEMSDDVNNKEICDKEPAHSIVETKCKSKTPERKHEDETSMATQDSDFDGLKKNRETSDINSNVLAAGESTDQSPGRERGILGLLGQGRLLRNNGILSNSRHGTKSPPKKGSMSEEKIAELAATVQSLLEKNSTLEKEKQMLAATVDDLHSENTEFHELMEQQTMTKRDEIERMRQEVNAYLAKILSLENELKGNKSSLGDCSVENRDLILVSKADNTGASERDTSNSVPCGLDQDHHDILSDGITNIIEDQEKNTDDITNNVEDQEQNTDAVKDMQRKTLSLSTVFSVRAKVAELEKRSGQTSKSTNVQKEMVETNRQCFEV
mmetsp:Transcript_5531/g.8159  ORF Transcript_5531/g.8159 Transcript_5531/m.8159 type:complete len:351 (-) Transcript_5531:284-1336(-)